MAECSYARCLQHRRHIKRELMKHYKDMLYIIGLERVGEELMGLRKWKQYQEAVTRSQLSADIRNLDQNDISNQKHEPEQKLEKAKENSHQQQSPQQQQQTFENDVQKIKTEVFDVSERTLTSPHIKRENCESSSGATEESIKLNNNTTNTSHKNNNNKKDNEELHQPPPTTSPQTPPPPVPIDWTPNEKCNFCVDGKLLTVNEKGELVAESSPALSEADLANRPPGDTDSDSSDSVVPDTRVNASKVLTSRFRNLVPSNMTSLQSMAAQAQWLQTGLGQFCPNILYNLTQHLSSATPTTSETSAAAISPSLKDSPSPSDLTGEQPLDLSSKPSPNSSIGGDARHVNRAKPRVTACTGRRGYTEQSLNNALQDIMSGKLGTRRAAVQYNIPRSTLRNKVYKISSGAKRETPSSLHHLASLEDLADVDDDKQNLSADEEDSSGEKLLGSSLASDAGDELSSRFGDANLAANIQKLCAEHNSLASQHLQPQHADMQAHNKPTTSLESQPKRKASTPQPPPPQTSPSLAQAAWPNVLLQTLLLSGSSLPMQPNIEEALQLFNALLLKPDPNLINPQFLMQLQQAQQSPQSAQQHLAQQQSQQQQMQLHANATGHPATVASFQNRQPKSETPETASSVDLNEALGDDPSTHILRIPSYKPVAGSSTSSTSSAAAATAAALCNNKNGESLPTNSPKIPTASSLLGANTSTPQLHHHHHLHPHHNPAASAANNIPGISPPLIRHTSGESQSPPTLSLRDMIANSISRNFSQQASKEATSPSPAHSASASAMDHNDQYKRPSISVIKNIGGTDTSRFATAPNILGSHHNSNHHHQQHHHHQHHSQNAANNNLAGGKGTRPKRGKYRNYDRDSLVEAVKAVQRGEMSVHRAGSYYGVPHSTLEYKVKERHLMRPRKREPKPQPPLDDRTGGSTSCGNSGSSANTSKNSNIPSLSAVNSLDKLSKNSGAAGTSANQKQAAAGKSNPPFPTTSPNGMKLPPAFFDQSLSAQLPYPILWHGGFSSLQMDLSSRSAAAAAVAVAAAAGGAPGNPYSAANAELFNSQMLQRFREERGPPNDISSPPGPAALSNPSPSTTNNSKSVREIAENLYDTSGANGSFLDGIIRKTLDRKSSDITQGALLDQLVKNNKPPPPRLMLNNERSPGGELLKLKRSGSPMQYHPGIEIKRERASPSSESSNSDSERNHRRDSDSEPPSQRHPGLHHALLGASTDLNGAPHSLVSMPTGNSLTAAAAAASSASSAAVSTSILQEKLGQIKSETEDSL